MWRSPLSMGFEGLLSSLKSRISAKDGGIIDKVTVKFRSCPCGLVDANGIKKPAKS